jgi:WD repeat-containing protein 61
VLEQRRAFCLGTLADDDAFAARRAAAVAHDCWPARAGHRAWPAQASKLFKREQAHKDSIWSVCWAKHTASALVTGSVDEVVASWEVRDEADKDHIALKHAFGGHNLGAVSVACSPHAPLCVSSGMDSRLRLLDLESGKLRSTIDAGPVECWTVSVSPDGQSVASGTHTGAVNVWSLATGALERTLEAPEASFVLSVAHSPDGSRVAAGTKDGVVRLFDLRAGKVASAIAHHSMPVRSLSFSPDGSLLFSACDDLTVGIFDAAKATSVGSLRGHLSWVWSVACSPDNRTVATGSADNAVKLWDIVERSCVHTFDKAHSDTVHSVAFNHDGSRLASVGGEGNVNVFAVAPQR